MRKPLQSSLAGTILLAYICFLPGCEQPSAPADAVPPSFETEAQDPKPSELQSEFTLPWIPKEGLNPYSGSSRINSVLFPLLFEPLFMLTPTFEAEPCLCASYSSVDALEYTLSLRTGAAFSDGSPLTAADVVYSLHKAMSPDSRYYGRFSDVSGIAAPDGQTVHITLRFPNAKLPSLLDIPIVKDGSNEGAIPIGTGPFLVERSKFSDSLQIRQDWWQSRSLPFQHVRLFEITSTADLLSAFQTRSVSLLAADLTGANTPGYRGDYEVRDCPSTVMLYLGCSSTEESSLLSDPALRRALMRGVDRTMIASSLYAEHAEPAALPLSPASADYNSVLADSMSYSRDTLRTLLEEAGWSDLDGDGFLEKQSSGKRIPLRLRLLSCADSSYKSATANALAETLAYAGVEIVVETFFWDGYLAALEAGEFDLYLGEVKLTADFDLRPLMQEGGALNYGRFYDAELEVLLDEARRSAGEEAVDAVQVRFAELAPILPILFKNESLLTQRDMVTGIVSTCQNPFYNLQAWTLNQTGKSE